MSFNFDNLSRPKSSSAPTDPFEIFAKTPNLPNVPNDLWKGQAEALKSWHENRTAEDNTILLNTGAGKSIVGVLIAQSLVNEEIGPVVFVCSTIDLVEQTARECERLGIKYTKRAQGSFSNDLFETGKAFCITTYQALFTPTSTFKDQKAPAAVLFDDAHVAERVVRDVFTLSVNRENFPQLFTELIQIVRPEFEAVQKGAHLNYILEQVGGQSVTMCPPVTSYRHQEQILESFKRVKDWRKTELAFPLMRLWENIGYCAIFVSSSSIEISPPFIPTGVYDFLGKGVRRVYLSATMEFETDFVRAFGVKPSSPIVPDNDAGNGERVILLSSRFAPAADKATVATEIVKNHKLLVSVPSYPRAGGWKEFGQPPTRDKFTEELQAFRQAEKGVFILVSRIDGIDLPQDACRVMLIDGAPSGSSLMDVYLSRNLGLLNLYSTKMASRITQLLGRINRGRSDYSAFVIYGDDINVWLKTERNIALLSPLIRKQVVLSQTVQEGMGGAGPADVAGIINQVIGRDQGWMRFYRETIDGLEVSSEALEKVKQREAQLAKSALAETNFMTRIWQGDIDGARQVLLDVLDDTALADARLAGWYSVWLAATYENAGDNSTAIAHYKKARARLSSWLNVPHKSSHDLEPEVKDKATLQRTLLEANHHGPQALGNLSGKLRAQANKLADVDASSNAKEEAVRMYGELLGYSATRPDNEYGQGPDVVWEDEETSTAIAFELKTEKNNPAEYNKAEVGQAHNHLQWMRDEMSESQTGGLLLVGPPGICKEEASPSDEIYLVETTALAARMRLLAAQIDDTRGRTAIDRWALLDEIGGFAEWQIPGWFGSLAVTKLKQLK